jgi:hypothetical protein
MLNETGKRLVTIFFFLVASTLLGAAIGATAAQAIKSTIK